MARIPADNLPIVAITNHLPDEHLQPLPDCARIIKGPVDGKLLSRQQMLELAPQLSAIICQAELRIDREMLDAAPKLKIVANVAIGTDNFDKDVMAQRGVWGTNVPDAFTDATADFTLALILAVARRIVPADRYVRGGKWREDGFRPGSWDGMLLSGKTLGIVGYGKIGKAVATPAKAFGMRVLFNNRTDRNDPCFREIDQLVRDADIVSLHVPLTPETTHLINARRLEMMKPGSVLINMSRGKVVDEEGLTHALLSRHLAGAGLDVFEKEPIVHPALLGLDNVVLTPHHGGGSVEGRAAARLMAAKNVAAVLRGEPPVTPVNTLPRSGGL
jgi:glyoxylate reductase